MTGPVPSAVTVTVYVTVYGQLASPPPVSLISVCVTVTPVTWPGGGVHDRLIGIDVLWLTGAVIRRVSVPVKLSAGGVQESAT